MSSSTFSASLPNGLLPANLKHVSDEYEHGIISFVKISLKLFSDGLHHQKGAIFGFGPAVSDETSNNVLKISSVNKETLSTLDNNVQVHNSGKESNVGVINYELSIRGEKTPASRISKSCHQQINGFATEKHVNRYLEI